MDITYFLTKKRQKKALRKQQRKERAIERELFMKKLESKPDQRTFFQLIRRNHAEVRSKIPDCIKKGEKTACTPSFAFFQVLVIEVRCILWSC
jgi:hypothetical protein